ncbi:STAS domain-containing protein [Streptomyces sp. NPDC051243]|uniref:STAS domain-containing protein n=1 Tax=Streptomyces sp. NPDC051243 TaxID=3365646 RepID=UPI0037B3014D
MRPFRFRRRRRGPPGSHVHDVVRLHGDLDARNAEATGRRLVRFVDAGPQVLEIDLANVRYLSPDGCAALFTALRAARARGTRLVLTHANERVRAVLQQIGLLRALSEGGRSTG